MGLASLKILYINILPNSGCFVNGLGAVQKIFLDLRKKVVKAQNGPKPQTYVRERI